MAHINIRLSVGGTVVVGGGLTSVTTDDTLSGAGTLESPLEVTNPIRNLGNLADGLPQTEEIFTERSDVFTYSQGGVDFFVFRSLLTQFRIGNGQVDFRTGTPQADGEFTQNVLWSAWSQVGGVNNELPEIELRVRARVLQYRLKSAMPPAFANLNPRLVLFRRVRNNRRSAKVQYTIPRIWETKQGNWLGPREIRIRPVGTPNQEGWQNLQIQHNERLVSPESILELFSSQLGGGQTRFRRGSRSAITIGNNGYFAQYFGIGFACDNVQNSINMNMRGQNLRFDSIAKFKAGEYRNPESNSAGYFFRIETN